MQLVELCVPLENDLSDWLTKFAMLEMGIQAHWEAGTLTYETPLPDDLALIFEDLRDAIPGFETRLAAIQITPPEEPIVPALPPVAAPRDDLEELKDEVQRMIRIVRGEEKEEVTRVRIPTMLDPWFGVIDALKLKEYGTTAEQATLGAKTGMLAAITTMFSATTFAAFMLEEGCQALGMSGWIAWNAKEYETAWICFSQQDELIRESHGALETWRPLMPLTYPGFRRFFDAARVACDSWFTILVGAMEKAGIPRPPTLAVGSKPGGARIYIDGEKTDTLTPETFRHLAPGPHTITAVLAATKTIPERGGSQEVTLEAGKKLEISLVLLGLEDAEVMPEAEPSLATLRILSAPTNAQIWVDGEDTGMLTPETFKDMPPGEYHVRVVMPPRGYTPERSAEITVTLTAGDKREVLLSLVVQS